MAGSRSYVALERRARRFGYNKLDANGAPSPSAFNDACAQQLSGFIGQRWGNSAEHHERRSTLDVDKLANNLSAGKPGSIRVSEDAGLYLCEYLYYCSLASAEEASRASQQSVKPVLFVHIPL